MFTKSCKKCTDMENIGTCTEAYSKYGIAMSFQNKCHGF